MRRPRAIRVVSDPVKLMQPFESTGRPAAEREPILWAAMVLRLMTLAWAGAIVGALVDEFGPVAHLPFLMAMGMTGLLVGATFLAPGPNANSWITGNYLSVAGAVSINALNNGSLYITGVKLEIGAVATPYNRDTMAKVLADCQRYYEVGSNVMCSFGGVAYSGSTAYSTTQFRVPKRVSPTMTYQIVGVNGYPSQAPAVWTQTPLMCGVSMTANGAPATPYYYYNWQAAAEI